MALRPVFVVSEVNKNGNKRPGELRDHVFDFENGFRAIISIDRNALDNDVYLHISISLSDQDHPEKPATVRDFLILVDNLPQLLWPGVMFNPRIAFLSEVVVHRIYDVPKEILPADSELCSPS